MAASKTDGQVEAKQALERLDNLTVVDCDLHMINVHLERYAPYIDEPYKSRILNIAKTDEPLAGSLVGSSTSDIEAQGHGLGDGIKTTTVEGIQNFMKRFKTDHVLLHGHQMELVSNVPEKKWISAVVRGYNDFMLDEFCDGNDGIKTSVTVAPQAPYQMAEEIDRLADEDDIVNVHVLSLPPNGLLGDPMYEPIYEAASDNGLSIDYHISVPNPPWVSNSGGPGGISTAENTSVGTHQNISHTASMIMQGIPEKYPDVKHIMLEQGITWVPWLEARLNKTYERRKHAMPWLDKKPSEYLHENFFFGTQPIENTAGTRNLTKIFEMMDAENMLIYTSDFPHYDFDYPSVLTIPHMSEEADRKIFGQNALDIMDF